MKQLLDLYQEILDNGIRQGNRTGIDTLTLPGAMLKFDLRDGFPAVTTKKLAWRQVKGELCGFLEGTTSLARFKELGCDVWDANVAAPAWQNSSHCQDEDHLGRVYGTQWRDWAGVEYFVKKGSTVGASDPEEMHLIMQRASVDQIAIALDTLRNNPQSRRILVNAWNPAELDQACLPPCHILFQLLPHVESKVLHMTMYQRSCDMFLGVPFNIASYALLLELFAAWSGYTAGTLTMFLADAHIYVNHIDQVKEQLGREPLPLPELAFSMADPGPHDSIDKLLGNLIFDSIQLTGYQHHPAIKAEMAV